MCLHPRVGFRQSNVSAGRLAASISAACPVQNATMAVLSPANVVTRCSQHRAEGEHSTAKFLMLLSRPRLPRLGENFPEPNRTHGFPDAPEGPGISWNSYRGRDAASSAARSALPFLRPPGFPAPPSPNRGVIHRAGKHLRFCERRDIVLVVEGRSSVAEARLLSVAQRKADLSLHRRLFPSFINQPPHMGVWASTCGGALKH